MATLVHDDLLDGATMRRGRPTVAQSLGPERAVTHRRLPVRPRLRRADPHRARPRRSAPSPRRPRPLPGRDRPAARRVRPGALRGGLPRALPAQDGRALLGGLPPRRPGRRRRPARPRSASPPSARTSAWPSRSSTTSSTWPARRGHRQAPRHRPLRRHGHAAGDPGAAARAGPAPARGRGLPGPRPRGALRPPGRAPGRWRWRASAPSPSWRRRARRSRTGPMRRGRRRGAARDRRRRRGPLLVSAPGRARGSRSCCAPATRSPPPAPPGVRAGARVDLGRDAGRAGWLVDGDEEGPLADHRAAHAAGPPERGRGGLRRRRTTRPRWPTRIDALAALAARDRAAARGVPRCRPRAEPSRPGSWGVEDLTVIAVCRLALPDGVAVRPHWRRLGPAACQVAVAFGASEWLIPDDDRTDPAALAAAVGRVGGPAEAAARRAASRRSTCTRSTTAWSGRATRRWSSPTGCPPR